MSNPLDMLMKIGQSDAQADNGSLGPDILLTTVAATALREEARAATAGVDADLAALATGMRSGRVQIIAITGGTK